MSLEGQSAVIVINDGEIAGGSLGRSLLELLLKLPLELPLCLLGLVLSLGLLRLLGLVALLTLGSGIAALGLLDLGLSLGSSVAALGLLLGGIAALSLGLLLGGIAAALGLGLLLGSIAALRSVPAALGLGLLLGSIAALRSVPAALGLGLLLGSIAALRSVPGALGSVSGVLTAAVVSVGIDGGDGTEPHIRQFEIGVHLAGLPVRPGVHLEFAGDIEAYTALGMLLGFPVHLFGVLAPQGKVHQIVTSLIGLDELPEHGHEQLALPADP